MHAEKAVTAFERAYGAKWPKAVAKITDDVEELLAFYDFRTKVTRGAGSPAAALATVFKLVESAQARWRAITGASLIALVRSGAKFENDVLVERSEVAV